MCLKFETLYQASTRECWVFRTTSAWPSVVENPPQNCRPTRTSPDRPCIQETPPPPPTHFTEAAESKAYPCFEVGHPLARALIGSSLPVFRSHIVVLSSQTKNPGEQRVFISARELVRGHEGLDACVSEYSKFVVSPNL